LHGLIEQLEKDAEIDKNNLVYDWITAKEEKLKQREREQEEEEAKKAKLMQQALM